MARPTLVNPRLHHTASGRAASRPWRLICSPRQAGTSAHRCRRWRRCDSREAGAGSERQGLSCEAQQGELYKDMKASRGRSFNLEHCWKLLQHSQKSQLIEKESPPKRGSLTKMDDDDEDDDGPRNKNKSDGNKKATDKFKRESETSSLHDRIDIMVQSDEVLAINTMETKKELAEKKA
ncbi:Lactation elevated protein 1 [Hordeum vulgare]|nr:Lactation elevated protein 1 [Hordeum vulgare]